LIVRGVILAGGGATRFEGRPKGLETVGGRRIIDRVADALAEATGAAPLLVANAADAAGWRPDLEVVGDDQPGLGALGGIYTAVVKGPAPVVVVAWDMPFVSALLLQALARGLDTADACLPSSGGPRGVEPLCAAYGPACRAAIEQSLAEGDLRAIGFHRFLRVGILPIESVSGLVDPALAFFNVNTAHDLAEAEASWQARASSRSSAGRTPARPR
jgi:molybdopterin-guanine dinucleotide biosynthesis protein A